jgi:CarD family transcriptional regulator
VTFSIGSTIIYPAHGAAKVVGRATRGLDGADVTYLELTIPKRGYGVSGEMKVSVPEDRAADLGVRDPISVEEADEVLEVLAVQNVRVPTNWSRRFKNHQEKLKSGDIYECAEVVRNLAMREATASISTAEKAMKAAAELVLASELAVTWDVDIEAAASRVQQTIADARVDAAATT